VFLILPITVAFAIFPGILVLQTGLWLSNSCDSPTEMRRQ